MSVMVLDSGNSIIKAKIARREKGEISFPHALRQLTDSEYQNIFSRASMNGNTKDYLRVNEIPYVVGESAERHGVLTQRSGASRFTRDYYGVLAAISLARLYGRGREVAVFGSHSPGDVKYREDLMQSVIGEWEVETESRKTNFRVIYTNTFDEPVGGLMNVLLTEDGQHYQYAQISEGRSLVIDIGGFTTDFLAVNPGGEVDYALAQSVPISAGVTVTTPQHVALDDSKRSLDMFEKLHIPISGIIENMSGFVCPSCQSESDIFDPPLPGHKRVKVARIDRIVPVFLQCLPVTDVIQGGVAQLSVCISYRKQRGSSARSILARIHRAVGRASS